MPCDGGEGDGARREASLAALVRANLDFIWKVLRRLGLSAARADDVTQEVFLVAVRRRDVIEPSGRAPRAGASTSGFGLWLGACVVDLSAYRGLSFRVSGETGPSRSVTLHVDTDADTKPERCRTNVGSCDPTGDCVSPAKRLTVPTRPGAPILVLWEELTGGKPRATPDPSRIIQLHWSFDWRSSGGTNEPYEVDLTIDDVELLP